MFVSVHVGQTETDTEPLSQYIHIVKMCCRNILTNYGFVRKNPVATYAKALEIRKLINCLLDIKTNET